MMEPDELVATTDSPASVDEKVVSFATFAASDVPPEPNTEKELTAVVPSSAALMQKESDETPDA